MPLVNTHHHRFFHLLSSARRRVFRVGARKDPAIFRLDDLVLHRIHEYLSLVDRVCLSLSCKRFFDLYGAALKHKDLTFPTLSVIGAPLRICGETKARKQLLLRLENRRWACCWKCLKLHPRREFPWYSLIRPSWMRLCTADAGIVDLCPCIALTLRGRERLIEFFESSPKPKTTYGPFEYVLTRDGTPYLNHYCTHKYRNGDYDLRVRVCVWINDAGRLGTASRYSVQFPSPKTYTMAEPIFVCPHQDILAPENWDWDGVKTDRTCVFCRTTYTTESRHRGNPVFKVIRNLGSCKWPGDWKSFGDITWYNQCRLPATSMALNCIRPFRATDVQRKWDVFTAAERARREEYERPMETPVVYCPVVVPIVAAC